MVLRHCYGTRCMSMSQTHHEQGLGHAHNSKQDQVQYKILDAQKCFLNLIGFPSTVNMGGCLAK